MKGYAMTSSSPQSFRTKLLRLSTISKLCLVLALLHHHPTTFPRYRLLPVVESFQIPNAPAFSLNRRRRIPVATKPSPQWKGRYCDDSAGTRLEMGANDIAQDNTGTATMEPPPKLEEERRLEELPRDGDRSKDLSITSTDSTPITNNDSTPITNNHTTPITNNESTANSENDNDQSQISSNEDEVPQPTAQGGFTHTKTSRAKISAANKGKVPWNKGRTRSPEEKARISAGVRKRNRERHLQHLAEIGLTEEEWEDKKKEERKAKDAEKRKRRTVKGGYRPTDETKKKISKILKGKYERGEIKKREYAGPFRKGFKHSEETKAKIKASLRKKWAEDPEYQAKMRGSVARTSSNNASVRAKISDTLKKKWQDPDFRAKMLTAISTRKDPTYAGDSSLRSEKISRAMKKKWAEIEYRKKTMAGMEKYRESLPPKVPRVRPRSTKRKGIGKAKKLKKVKKEEEDFTMVMASPVVTGVDVIKKRQVAAEMAAKKKEAAAALKEAEVEAAIIDPESMEAAAAKAKKKPAKKRKKNDGDISVMREERRDLYDLLYGDDAESKPDVGADEDGGDNEYDEDDEDSIDSAYNGDRFGVTSGNGVVSSQLDDENLDTFDPYGLEDF